MEFKKYHGSSSLYHAYRFAKRIKQKGIEYKNIHAEVEAYFKIVERWQNIFIAQLKRQSKELQLEIEKLQMKLN